MNIITSNEEYEKFYKELIFKTHGLFEGRRIEFKGEEFQIAEIAPLGIRIDSVTDPFDSKIVTVRDLVRDALAKRMLKVYRSGIDTVLFLKGDWKDFHAILIKADEEVRK